MSAIRDAVLGVLAALAIGLVRVVWGLAQRVARLEGKCDRRPPSDRGV